MAERVQVAIVGGGPMGLALAVDLGLRGLRCAVVERRAEPHRIPKGQNLTPRSVEHFHFRGIADALRAARTMPPGYPEGSIVACGDLTGRHWYAPPQRELLRPYYFQRHERLPQYRTEEVLRRRLAALPGVRRLFGWEAVSVEQDEVGARVTAVRGDGAERRVLEADYAAGCDGAGSLVREQAGIARSGTDFDQRMVLAVFRSRGLDAGLARFPPRSTYRVMHRELRGYWRFFGRVDDAGGWFFHAPAPAEATGREGVRALLARAAGFRFDCDFAHVGFWPLRVSIADDYRAGRIFLAGDAAHSHPPYGGFGLNNGLEDAINLGWKLSARLKGWGGETLLRSYGEERRPVSLETGRRFIADRIERDRAFFDRHAPGDDGFDRAWKDHAAGAAARVLAFEPNYEGSPIVAGPPGAVCGARGEHVFAARSGHHLPPRRLSTGRDVFEELGPDFTLLAFGAAQGCVGAIRRAAVLLGIPLKVVADEPGGERAAYETRLILLRPDQHVAWTGDRAPDDPVRTMAMAAGRP